MSLSSGVRLGVYEILAKLGEGGMGEVYRARDTRLKRDVAIKVLPDAFARDPDRLTRFEREAELLATLNHPNIASVYGFEEASSVNGIVLELVEGPTLGDRIAQAAIPVDEALIIARQVTDALEAAHQKGIVHRDLKPANIKLTPGGQVKVLDFGLAKAMESATAPIVAASISPTMVSPATQAGIVLGTAAYMSPEQARGKAVDQRADIWAFGCVLFEMLTGRSPFGTAETVSDSIAAILTREPDWTALPADTPSSVRRLLRRCMQKDVSRRLNHIGDARLELDDSDSGLASGSPTPLSSRRTMLPWAIAALGIGVALAATFWPRAERSVETNGTTRLELNLPDQIELYTSSRTIAVSPDGTRLAFVGVSSGARRVYVRRLDQFEIVPLRGTDAASTCTFSADGSSIGFVTSNGALKTISLADGVVQTLAEEGSNTSGVAWTRGNTIVYQSGNALWRIPHTGGTPQPVTKLDTAKREERHTLPTALPDGRTILFVVLANGRWRIDMVDLSSGARRAVVETATLPLYTAAGHLVFVRDGRILAAPFDAEAVAVTDTAVQLLDNVPMLATDVPLIDVSLSGTIVYSPTTAVSRLVWTSRNGDEQVLNDQSRNYANPRLSPDGQRIIVQAGDLWMQDLIRGTFSRLTNGDLVNNAFPRWLSNDRVIYRSTNGMRIQGTNGPGDRAQLIPGTTFFDYPGPVAPDGDTMLFLRSTDSSSFDIHTLSLRDPSKIETILKTPAYEGGVGLSPDGKWLSYVSDETGRNEVYLSPYPALGVRHQVSTEGGTQPAWSLDGQEIFYRIGDKVMAVGVTPAPLKLSAPRVLFEARYAYGAGTTIANFDISRDGRFVMVKPDSAAGRLNVVLNSFGGRGRPDGR